MPREGSETDGWTENQKELPTAPTHHAGLATMSSSLLRVGSVRRLDSLCLRDRDQNAGEPICCIVEVTSKDILDQNAHFLCEVVLPTAAQRWDVAVSEFEECLRVRDIRGLEELVRSGLIKLGHVCIQYLRICFVSGSLGLGQAGTPISGLEVLRTYGTILWC